MSTVIPVILAGGQGTRLWPASLPTLPKQFLRIGDEVLLQQAIERAAAITDDSIVIVTHEQYFPLFIQHCTQHAIDPNLIHLIGEPASRNTAPAIALATQYIQHMYDDAILLVITADHRITPLAQFVSDAHTAISIAKEGYIVTFGIPPTRPETGYGYIEYDAANSIPVTIPKNIPAKRQGYTVRSFREKPDAPTALRYLNKGNFLWNSGIFCFSVQSITQDLNTYCTELYTPIFKGTLSWQHTILEQYHTYVPKNIAYDQLKKISIDYAVMEHTVRAAMVPVHFNWNDIGSWDEAAALYQVSDALSGTAPVYLSKSDNVTVCAAVPVAVCGVSDIVVVAEHDRVLVMKKGQGQLVSDIAHKDAHKDASKDASKNSEHTT